LSFFFVSLCKQFLVKSTKTKTGNGQLAIWQQRTQRLCQNCVQFATNR